MSLKFKLFYEKYYLNKPESGKWNTTRLSKNPIRAYATATIYRQASFAEAHSTSESSEASSTNSVPLLRCSTTSHLPDFVHSNESLQSKTVKKSSKDRHSLLNLFDDAKHEVSHISASPSLWSTRTTASRCSTTSKTSLTDSCTADDEDESPDHAQSYLDYRNMSKPYSFMNVGPPNLASIDGKGSSKNVTVTCNSVMGNPRKLGRRLIRRGSATEIKEDLRPAVTNVGRPRPPMHRTQTMGLGEMKIRCNSNENVNCESQPVSTKTVGAISPQNGRKFVKQKSSVDLLLENSNIEKHNSSTSLSSTASQVNKFEKKRLEKLKSNMKSLLDLFTAVEQDDIGTVRSTLQHNEVDINGTNMDDLTLLDVAIMLNHKEVAQLLLKFGAQENPRLSTQSLRAKHLQSMIDSAQSKSAELTTQTKQTASPLKLQTAEKQMSALESRIHMLKKMRNNLENSGVPGSPKNVLLQVSSATSLSVSFEPPDQTMNVVTKYKIEWSMLEDFHKIEGVVMVKDLRRLEVTINSLITGELYFVRASAGNYKGFSEPILSHPNCAVPSSWRVIDSKDNRSAGRLQAITELYHEIKLLKSTTTWQKLALPSDSSSKKKKNNSSFKNIFLGGSKFQKSLKRGVYLATLLYKDDKVLCTVDECVPIVEIDEMTPSSIVPDYLWFMKLSCAWDDMKSLNFSDLDQIQRSSSLMFRLKLLEAASAMQMALGVKDLGRLHCSPIVDSRGVTILVTVQYVQDQKSIQGLAVKWLSISKLFKRQSPSLPSEKEISAMDLLLLNLLNVLNFYESTYIPLDRGLYLGYVKLHSTMHQISIVVPENLPSVLPFFYIRDNPHVSKEEWEWLRELDSNQVEDAKPSASQLSFHWSLASAAKILLADLEISDDDMSSHRVYCLEVLEVHPDVTFILIVPSHADVCSAPGQQRLNNDEKRGCFALPVPMFEVAHMCTYQPDFIALYCRLSVFLDFYVNVLQQLQRMTLNDAENKQYKQQLDCLTGYQIRLDDIWKAARWISNVATAARDKQIKVGLQLATLFAYSAADFQSSAVPLPTTTHIRRINNDATVIAAEEVRSHESSNSGVSRQRSLPLVVAQNGQSQWHRRQERKRSSDHSSSDQGEDNSDVGYHSDQSIDKAAGGTNDQSAKPGGGASSSTTVFSASSHVFMSMNRKVEAVNNPIYDFLSPTFLNGQSKDVVGDVDGIDDTNAHVARFNTVQRICQSKMLQQKYGDDEQRPSKDATLLDSHLVNNMTYRTNISIGASSHVTNNVNANHPPRYGSFASLSNRRGSATSSEMSTIVNSRREYVNFIGSPTAAFEQLESIDNAGVQFEPTSVADMTSFFQAMTMGGGDGQLAAAKFNSCFASSSDESEKRSNVIAISNAQPSAASSPAMSAYRCESSLSDFSRPSTSADFCRQPTSANLNRESEAALRSTAPSRTSSNDASSPTIGILRVFAAYPCGLAKGTSVKLQITQKTTSKEVIRLVVQQLNKAVKLKGLHGPLYDDNSFDAFCLVAVIGARERCLRDDFAPLELQNPWSKGKLFVRRRNDLLAALEFGNEAKV